LIQALASGFACFLMSLLLVAIWRNRAWGDAAIGQDAARKLQLAAVPAIGGLSIGMVWFGQELCGAELAIFARPLGILALIIALASGMLDDARATGLRPLTKLTLQALAGTLLGALFLFPSGLGGQLDLSPEALSQGALALFAALVFQNGVNTFDNADGAASSVGGAGFLVAGSPLAPAVLAFLIPNLVLRRSSGKGAIGADPVAYLGDGGSQLLGLALLMTPGARMALMLPLLDLARVALLRLAQGSAPWVGDRRHLAHRLQRRGLSPIPLALLLTGISLPALFHSDIFGVSGTAILYLAACIWTREPQIVAESDGLAQKTGL
jgi:UDP-GlcNAc:undecaprenyl-phosphate GlcNAc-1-phosphate transferase